MITVVCRLGPEDRATAAYQPWGWRRRCVDTGSDGTARGRLRLVGFCTLAVTIVTMTTMMREVTELPAL
jgi:hypothetical protein